MLLLIVVSLFIPNIYATTTNQQNTNILNNTTTYSENNSVYSYKTYYKENTIASNHQKIGAINDAENTPIKNSYTIISTPPESSNQTQNTENIQYAIAAAGDETLSNVQNNWFTTENITEAAGRVKSYIEINHKLPTYVTMGNVQVTMPQFLQLMTTGLIQIKDEKSSSISLKTVNTPTNTSENLKNGIINKAEYLDLAVRIQSYINSNGKAPNFASSSLGKVGYQSLIYMYSRILSYYDNNNVLPQTASLKSWESVANQTDQNASGNETNEDGFTIVQISTAANTVKTFIEQNKRLPNFVLINGKQLTMPEFLELLNTGLIQIDGKDSSLIVLKSASAPTNPSESLQSGSMNKAEYIDLASRVQSYMDSVGKIPNYASSTLGKIRYESLIFTYSKIYTFYNTNNRLPNTVTINSWASLTGGSSSDTVPDSMQIYLEETNHAESTNPTIIALADSITAGCTTTYSKAVAIFNWVSDNITYSYYYNSKKGALGTLSSRTANCCDTTNLLVALTRAAGIPARYEHGECIFSDGVFGHVWAQVYVNGNWYRADAISDRNSFGVINNWDTSNWTLVGIYAELPF
jgi:hypothetical protein